MTEEAWLRVGEVARRTGLTVRTLHHYDQLGLLVPSGRSHADYRLYSEADLRRLLSIQHLKSLGLGLDEVAAALDDAVDATTALEQHIAAVEARVAAEADLLRRLRGLRDVSGSGWNEVIEAIALTERLRHPEPGVRFRAALETPGAPLEDLVAGLVTDPEPGVREALTWAVAHHGSAATDAITAHLGHPDPTVRRQMAHVLGKLLDPAGVGPLARALGDPDPLVAAKAAQGLGQLGAAGADAALAPLLDHLAAPDPTVAEAVLAALATLGAPAVPALLLALADDKAVRRARAAEALGMIADPIAADALAAATADADPEVVFEALVALGQLPGTTAEAAIEGCLHSPDDRLRLVAERLLSDRRRSAPPAT